jgi:hypothetical protein
MALSRRDLLASMLAAPAALRAAETDGWVSLFDGKSLDGWQPSENTGSWKVLNGALTANGPRSHLFYKGPVRNADFKNFELKAEWMSQPGANSGIYFHSEYQEKGFPKKGFEIQINNTHEGEGNYRERKKSGSLYGVRNVYKQLAKDNEWNETHLVVRNKQVQVFLNGKLLVDFSEPAEPVLANERGRMLDHGTFALQGHDPHSTIAFRKIVVKVLADDAASTNPDVPVVDELYRDIIAMAAANIPMVDYHVHLRANGFTTKEALENSRRVGIQYGFAINLGVTFPTRTDEGVRTYYNMVKDLPTFYAVQGEGREWHTLASKETLALFDYLFTDAMTYYNDAGKRLRLWMKDELGPIEDREEFMKLYMDRAVGILNTEPIDIFVSPTYIPDVLQPAYEEIWTAERMSRLIEAAVKNDVAIELNNRYNIPNAAFVKLAKQAGVKFTFGSNNATKDIGRLEYPIKLAKECGLTWRDFWIPRPEGQKAIQRKR